MESPASEPETSGNARRRGGRRSRNGRERTVSEPVEPASEAAPVSSVVESQPQPVTNDAVPAEQTESKPRRGGRRPRKSDAAKDATAPVVESPAFVAVTTGTTAEAKPAKAKRPSRPRKAKVAAETPES